ncbi:MAG: hypothetical protein HY898_06665 [Deltaproteobacteria bacterium]|nr:hypothetical protein [Deltaproteobacteria bacterium]
MTRLVRSAGPCAAIAVVALVAGCSRRSESPAVPAAHESASAREPASARESASARAPASAAAPALPTPAGATACGDHGCIQFDSPEAALRYVLETKPLVLAIGEAHAQKGKEGVDSSAKRFTDLLPMLKGSASDLVLELMMPNNQCKKKTEQVREKQKVVTSKQADTNQNEYVKMGERSRQVGIIPDLLRPACEDLDAIDKAGEDSIPVFLSTIARLTRVQVEKLLDRNGKTPADAGKMVVTYGGVLHNDLEPPKALSDWSFGPQLSERVGKRYVELDMFVPEFIENTDTWRKLEWFPHYDRDRMGSKTTMFRPRPGSFVLIFPMSKPASP